MSRDKQKYKEYQREYKRKNRKRLNELEKQSNRYKLLHPNLPTIYVSDEYKKLKKKEYDNRYKEKYPGRIKLRKKLYFQENKSRINEKILNKLKTNIYFKLGHNLRSRFRRALNGGYKTGSAVRDLGCSIEEFKKYIESKFKDGMTWENYGFNGWHLDHIIPLYNFDLTNREQLLKAVNYTNFQPLWSYDNFKKNKYDRSS